MSPAGARLLDDWLAGHNPPVTEEAAALRSRLIRAGMVHPVPAADGDPPPVAFVVPVYDDVGGLEQLLRALRRNYPDDRIIVVDDSSPSGERIAAVADSYAAELIRHPTNRGPAAARNTGWQRSVHSPGECTLRPDVVVFVDADVVPRAGALAITLAHFRDSGVAAVAPRVRAAAGSSHIAGYEASNSPLDLGAAAAIVFPGTRVSYVPSACLAIRTSVLKAAAGFDEDLRFGEDVDLIWRLVEQQHLVRYEPRAVVEHRNRTSLAALARQRFSYGSSAAPLAARHGSKVAPLQMPANVVVAALAAMFGGSKLRLVAVASAAASTVLLARKLDGKVDAPEMEAARLTALSHGYAGQGLATAATRSWAPLLMLHRRTRRALLIALVAPAIIDWIKQRPAIDPLTHTALRAFDHGSYCAGVWAGVWRSRSLAALLPSVRFATRNHD